MPAKNGRMTNKEREYILKNVERFSVEEMATKLNRTVSAVEEYIHLNYIKKNPVTKEEQKVVEQTTIRKELRSTEEWKNLKDEFNTEELRLFDEKYIKLMAQFKGNVLATEETQIYQAIKFEILMSRNLRARRKALDDIARLGKMLDDYLDQFRDDPASMSDSQKTYSLNLQMELKTAEAAEQSKTTEYTKLQERHDSLMKNLKATRDQRVKEIESGKVSFLGLIKSLQEKEIQDKEGRQLELMKLASKKEYRKLGALHNYQNGEVDRPILSAETVEMEL